MGDIRNHIRELRLEKNITQEDFATRIGVTRQTVIAIEKRSYKPSLELAFKISRIFKKHIEDIFTFNS